MDNRQKQRSGFQKRKIKEAAEREKAKLPKLDRFFSKTTAEDDNEASSMSTTTETAALAPAKVDASASTTPPRPQSPSTSSTGGGEGDRQREQQPTEGEHDDEEESVQTAAIASLNEYPTDIGLFPDKLDDNTKKYIVSMGPCRPTGPFPRDPKDNRCFSTTYYTTKTKAGIEIPRAWLCYSPKLDITYCQSCWLFADRSVVGKSWQSKNWRCISNLIHQHETSSVHTAACVVYDSWRLNKIIDKTLEEGIRQEANFWRQVIERLINVTLTLAMNNIPFRGHREILGHSNSGNFLAIVELLAKYDPVLNELISRPAGSMKYLSPKIQNELIDILAQRIKKDILDELQAAPFFSVIMDTTQDIAKIDQMSQIFRYVTIERDDSGVASDVKVKESFLGFREVSDQSASELAKDIMASIEDNGLDLSKCRGQGYDGAANMSGVYSGVQARIAAKEPLALYVHCATHNLNLLINDSVKNIPELVRFYDTVESIYVFFGHSIKRWAILANRLATDHDAKRNVTIKRLCPTRWSSRYDAVSALRYRYSDVLKALTDIALTSNKKDEVNEALSLKRAIEKFSFICIVVLQTKILERTNTVSKLLQAKDADLSAAVKLLDNTMTDLQAFRDRWAEMLIATK